MKRSTPTWLALAAAVAVALMGMAAAASAAAEDPSDATRPVLAESFEAPLSSNYTVVRAGQTLRTRNHAWQVEQASIDIVNTSVRHEAAPYDGNQVIDLAGSPGPGVMSTRFATTPGQRYTLVVHYARNNGIGRTPAVARVEVVGAALLLQQELRHDPVRLPFNAWREYRASFRADSAQTTLRFASHNAGNFGLLVDAVTVTGRDPGAPAKDAAMAATAPRATVSPVAMTGGSVEAKFRGTWVPAKAGCASPVKLVIEAKQVSFVNGTQRADFRKLEQCFTCAAGAMAVEQPTWLTTDAMGDSPFTVTMDGTRKQVAVSVDFSNDKKLGARFPLGTAALKQCPA